VTPEDQLVEAYLHRLRRAARPVPRDQREELVGDIESHIAAARRLGSGEAYMRNVLDALGDPDAIVAGIVGPTAATERRPRDLLTIVLLLLGGLIIPFVGWLAGVVLLWCSSSWTVGRKLLGTLVWPGGLLLAFRFVLAPSWSVPRWAAYLLLAVSVLGPFAVSVDLYRHARPSTRVAADHERTLV
jgi:hypothetical protein